MDFLDPFWVPQIDKTDEVYLLILIFIDFTLLIFEFIAYLLIRRQVQSSLKPPSPDSTILLDQNILKSIRHLFIGANLILISSIISRSSFFLELTCPPSRTIGSTVQDCILLVGQEDFISLIGFQFMLIGIYNLFHDIALNTEVGKNYQSYKFQPYYWVIVIELLVLILPLFLLPQTIFLINIHTLFVMMVIIVINAKFAYDMSKLRDKGRDNPITQFRKRVLHSSFYAIPIVFMALSAFFVPTSDGGYPTETAWVEFFITGIVLISAFFLVLILVTILFPSNVLNFLGFTPEEVRRYGDPRLDHTISYSLFIESPNPSPGDMEQRFVLTYQNDEKLICELLSTTYRGESIPFQEFNQETLRKITLPNVDIIYLDSSYSQDTVDLLEEFETQYQIHLEYAEHQVIYQYVEFSSKTQGYALLIIRPSTWNSAKKFWQLLFTAGQSIVLTHFMQDFYDYLVGISEQSAPSIVLLRFDFNQGKYQDIPRISPKINIPDPSHVQFL